MLPQGVGIPAIDPQTPPQDGNTVYYPKLASQPQTRYCGLFMKDNSLVWTLSVPPPEAELRSAPCVHPNGSKKQHPPPGFARNSENGHFQPPPSTLHTVPTR